MRKFNAFLTAAMMLTFLAHAIFGAFQLFGIGDNALKVLARITVVLAAVHAVLGVIMTVQTLYAQKKAGVRYFMRNKLFWIRRISGFIIAVLLVFHITAFMAKPAGDAYRLATFNTFKLITQILLVLSIAVHVISNIKPALMAFGIKSLKPYATDILIVVSVLLLVFIAAFIVYFIRWNALG